ncbi:MAG: RNA polymerase factor sigma-54, partial [Eubacterium sp.]|nr:RNA polymerase factor sigma-54 [Eubacterium sp.]
MDISQGITIENRQLMSQTQIQSLEILTMDSIELEEFLQDEFINNPLLDCNSDSVTVSGMDRVSLWEPHSQGGGKGKENDEEDLNLIDNIPMADDDYLKQYLLDQLDPHRYNVREWNLCSFLIDCLEDDGYFRMDTDQITYLTGCSTQEIDKVLSDLRYLEPCGIFAEDLQHCLLRQLEEMEMDTSPMKEIVLYHLADIAEGKISSISRSLDISTSEVRRCINIIRELNSRPLSGFRGNETVYITPDIIYARSGDHWDIRIRDGGLSRYHLNDYYIEMMNTTRDEELKDYFRKKLDRCRFILSSIERRQKTMELIARAILKNQEGYFRGQDRLKPMTMVQVAEETGLHQSTVGRAVRGKYIQSPVGTVLIKKLFCGKAAQGDSGSGVTAERIKELIVSIIDGENKKKPYSDAKIVELLTRRGIHISRRAVAKYREELWIKS